MSEEILKAIIQLLAIVAKEDDVTSDERASIESLLLENLTREDTTLYMEYFEKKASKVVQTVEKESDQIALICIQINKNQTVHEKIVIILNLMELIAADSYISPREDQLVYEITENLNIPKNVTDLIRSFVIYKEQDKIVSSNLLIVDNGTHNIPEQCKHIKIDKLKGFIFVLRIPEPEIYFTKYVGDEDVLLNGAPMRSNRVRVFALGSVIKSRKIEPLFHSDVVNKFRQAVSDSTISFLAENVGFKFSNGNIGLRDINIAEEGGRLLAIMGGSGAGKSTLLNVLNGNDTPSDGSVKINGINIHSQKKSIEGVIGFIPQEDLLVEELTVYENLYFAAKLCFKNYSKSQLAELVNNTLDSLGLYEAKNLKVGSALDKSISGGQRKRVNIGLELLREPSVLFVDEPTSGLSSRDSENIMDLLKELSLRGKMIFVVIHQPSEDIFKMFDKLILLDVGGYQIYYGNPVEAVTYFKEIVRMVDRRHEANPEQIFNIIEAKVVNEFGNFTSKRKTTSLEWNIAFKERIKIPEINEALNPPKKTLDIPNRIKQFIIFSQRDIKTKLANKQYLIVNFLEAPVLALILALIIRYIPEDTDVYHFKENLNMPIYLFMSVIVSLFMGMTVSAEEIIRDRRLLKRESFLNLSRLSYLKSKIGIMFTLSAIQTLTFVLIGNGLLMVKGMTFSFWLTLFSVSCFANLLGLNVSSAFKSAITVYVLIPLLIIPQLILSGVVVNFDKLNPAITNEDKVPIIGEIMASRWAYEALSVTQFKSNAYEKNFYPYDKIRAQSEFKTVYLIPRLESEIEFIHHHFKNPSPEDKEKIAYNFKTINTEINKELIKIGHENFPEFSQLNEEGFNDEVFDKTIEFLGHLRTYYNRRSRKADDEKRAIMASLTSTPEDRENFIRLRYQNENEAIATIVKNTTTEHRILEHNNHFIQKIYPIYMDPDFPAHPFDFRSQFFTPVKYFLGYHVDTLIFNNLIIWAMILFMAIALYYEWLLKIISGYRRK